MSDLKILFLGDIFGRPGRKAVKENLAAIRAEHNLDFVVANGENATSGRGLSAAHAQDLLQCGIDVITLGDHAFDQRDITQTLSSEQRVLRPANFTKGTAGRGFNTFTCGDKKIGVMNLHGTVFMRMNVLCPFAASRAHMAEHTLGEDYDALIIDAHTEATSEIAALGYIWDGHASLVVGTHTHIPTADTRVQPKGTAFQSDAGMCGVFKSSLGMDFDGVVKRFENSRPYPMQPAAGTATMCGVIVTVGDNGLATSVTPLRVGGDLQATGV